MSDSEMRMIIEIKLDMYGLSTVSELARSNCVDALMSLFTEEVVKAREDELRFWFGEYMSAQGGSGEPPADWLNTKPISIVRIFNRLTSLKEPKENK